MKTPAQVEAIRNKPGVYRFDQATWYWFFEVAEDGKIHQLNPETMQRDGVLSDDRWNFSGRFGTVTLVEAK